MRLATQFVEDGPLKTTLRCLVEKKRTNLSSNFPEEVNCSVLVLYPKRAKTETNIYSCVFVS